MDTTESVSQKQQILESEIKALNLHLSNYQNNQRKLEMKRIELDALSVLLGWYEDIDSREFE